jgi:hypothetical protein
MCRTAEFLPTESICLAYPGFRLEKERIAETGKKRIERLVFGPGGTLW